MSLLVHRLFLDSGDDISVEEISSGDNPEDDPGSHAATGVVVEGMQYYGVLNIPCDVCIGRQCCARRELNS